MVEKIGLAESAKLGREAAKRDIAGHWPFTPPWENKGTVGEWAAELTARSHFMADRVLQGEGDAELFRQAYRNSVGAAWLDRCRERRSQRDLAAQEA